MGVINLDGVSLERIGKSKKWAILIAHPHRSAKAIRALTDDETSLLFDYLSHFINSTKSSS